MERERESRQELPKHCMFFCQVKKKKKEKKKNRKIEIDDDEKQEKFCSMQSMLRTNFIHCKKRETFTKIDFFFFFTDDNEYTQ